MARGLQAMMALTGMDRHPKLNAVNVPQIFNVSSAHKWHDRIVLTHASNFPQIKGSGDRIVTKRLRERFAIESGNDGRYDYTSANAFTFKNKADRKSITHSTLNAMQTFVQDGDAFIFGPLAPSYRKTEEAIIHQLFQFMSLTVGMQVYDPAVYGKFWGIYGHDWDDCKAVYDDFHRMGLIGQKPEHIFTAVEDSSRKGMTRRITEVLEGHFRTYRRLNFPEPRFFQKGKEPEGLFRTVIYCSATSTDQALRQDAFNLSYKLASLGCAVKNGGGTEGLMVETSNGVHGFRWDAARSGERRIPECGIVSDQYEYTMRAEGLCEWNDCVRVHPSIFSRLEELQNADLEIMLAGGGGTIQELTASIITRLGGRRPVKNRPFIVVNQKIWHNNSRRGVFDNLMRFIPKKIQREANVVVVYTIEEAVAHVVHARKAMGIEPRFLTAANDPAAFVAGKLNLA
jgi:predicted Rossmann-fold nucleotide-binding protein